MSPSPKDTACSSLPTKPGSDPAWGASFHILVVDDSSTYRAILNEYLTHLGHQVATVTDGRQALEALGKHKFDLVLLDVMMPELNGYQVLQQMKSLPALREIPVIMVSTIEESHTAARCIQVGAEDYLTKPIDKVLLEARLNASLEKKRLRDQEVAHLRQLFQLKQRLAQRNKELEDANRRLELAAFTDVLTGLPNRRYALDLMARFWATSIRTRQPIACLLVDIDHFKRVNDTHGHDVGDHVLCEVGSVLRKAVRTSDVVCRLGGEEFIVVCPATDQQAASVCGERVRASVAANVIPFRSVEHRVTVSVGAAALTPTGGVPEDLVKAADEGVYEAKKSGRNRVCAPKR